MMYILIIGTPINGFEFEGLFTNEDDATMYGELVHSNTEWWIAPLAIKLITSEYICGCNHKWSDHKQNVHNIYVCSQCDCRGVNPPPEKPKHSANNFGKNSLTSQK